MTTAGRKPHVPRNAGDVKADFSRVYFQNVRLLLAGTAKSVRLMNGYSMSCQMFMRKSCRVRQPKSNRLTEFRGEPYAFYSHPAPSKIGSCGLKHVGRSSGSLALRSSCADGSEQLLQLLVAEDHVQRHLLIIAPRNEIPDDQVPEIGGRERRTGMGEELAIFSMIHPLNATRALSTSRFLLFA